MNEWARKIWLGVRVRQRRRSRINESGPPNQKGAPFADGPTYTRFLDGWIGFNPVAMHFTLVLIDESERLVWWRECVCWRIVGSHITKKEKVAARTRSKNTERKRHGSSWMIHKTIVWEKISRVKNRNSRHVMYVSRIETAVMYSYSFRLHTNYLNIWGLVRIVRLKGAECYPKTMLDAACADTYSISARWKNDYYCFTYWEEYWWECHINWMGHIEYWRALVCHI